MDKVSQKNRDLESSIIRGRASPPPVGELNHIDNLIICCELETRKNEDRSLRDTSEQQERSQTLLCQVLERASTMETLKTFLLPTLVCFPRRPAHVRCMRTLHMSAASRRRARRACVTASLAASLARMHSHASALRFLIFRVFLARGILRLRFERSYKKVASLAFVWSPCAVL